MKASRRRFLLYSGTAVLTAATTLIKGADKPGLAKNSSSVDSNKALMSELRLSTFKPLRNSTFQVQGESHKMSLKLVEVAEKSIDAKLEQFYLTFEGPTQDNLDQNFYHLDHPKLGQIDLFLVPVGLDHPGQYTASFSQLLA